MPGLPTGTVTFLFTDIEGATTLLQHLGDQRYAQVLAEHQRLLRDAFAKGNGQEIDTQGDAFLVVFPRARDAVSTAVAAQQALQKHPWPDGASLQVRMGLHTGEPISNTDRYVGLDVHRAARIGAAGHGGQILLSEAVRGLAVRDLPPEVSLRDLGSHWLKDLQEPEHIFQVVHPDLPSGFPRLKSLDALPNNLPRQLTSFIGREKEIAEVKRLLSITCLLTIIGAGGAGKTRLAVQVAADVAEQYPDGVWLVELASLSDPALVPAAVAAAVGIRDQAGRGLPLVLSEYLQSRHVLLVVDNCEHLIKACASLVDTLVRSCPHIRVLATSREALSITGETAWRVPSLPVPDPAHLPSVGELNGVAAVRLFVDRAATVAPGFVLTSQNARAIVQTCSRLDGMPLAIELAAARTKVLTPQEIAARLDDRFRLLVGPSRASVPRQQTLRAVMDWSYDLLSAPEQAVLRRFSVFSGGATLQAAEVVCAGEGVEPSNILDLLAQLVDKSLVLTEAHDGTTRYRLLETTRQFGLDRLEDTGETSTVFGRHLNWYVRLAEDANARMWGPDLPAWLTRLDAEYDNFRGALAWRGIDDSEATGRARIVWALSYFWFLRGHWTEARRWAAAALNERHLVPRSMHPKLLVVASAFASQQGDVDAGLQMANEGLAIHEEFEDVSVRSWLLFYKSLALGRLGTNAAAAAAYEETIRVAQTAGPMTIACAAHVNLAACAAAMGEHDRAKAIDERALAYARDVADPCLIAFALYGDAQRAKMRGDLRDATKSYRESLTQVRPIKHQLGISVCLIGLADIACASVDYARAARLLGAADNINRIVGISLIPRVQADYERGVLAARTAMGADAFETAHAEGRSMALEQAIEYALATEPEQ